MNAIAQVVASFTLLIAAAVTAHALPLGPAARAAFGIVAAAAAAVLLLATARGARPRLLALLVLMVSPLLLRLPPALLPLGFGAIVMALERAGRRGGAEWIVPAGTGAAAAAFGIVHLALALAPAVLLAIDAALRRVSGTCAPIELGWTAAGGSWLLLALLAIVAAPRAAPGTGPGIGRGRRAVVLLSQIVLFGATLPLLGRFIAAHPERPFEPGAWLGAAWLAVAAITATLAARGAVIEDALAKPASSRLSRSSRSSRILALAKPAAAAGTCFVLLAGVLLVRLDLLPQGVRTRGGAHAGGDPARASAAGRVLIVNEGGLDWHRPRFGKFGDFDGGMFGLLPLYLRASGFEVEVTKHGAPTDAELAASDVLLLINDPRRWRAEERAAITAFVRRGGSVLVLGDHTNVFGLQDGFDSLLAEHGIRFRFDSAYHARASWQGCIDGGGHLLADAAETPDFGHAIGASLAVAAPAVPIVTAPFSFSDAGIAGNVMGSFLGDYSFEPGERLGDLALVAARFLGRGRILVYGDTSAFQNASLPSTYVPHVLPLVRRLAVAAAAWERPMLRAGVALLLMAIAGVALRRGLPPLLVAIVLLPALVPTYGSGGADPPFPSARSIAWIDAAHLPRVGHYEARRNPVFPLATNLARSGLLPAWRTSGGFADLGDAPVLVLVAPARELSEREVGELLAYLERGGLVLVAASAPDAGGVRPLLRALALDVVDVPLGAFPYARGGEPDPDAPRLLEAWPVVALDDSPAPPQAAESGAPRDARLGGLWPLIEQDGHVAAAARRFGRGSLVVIGDTRFFSMQSFEEADGPCRGNVLFFFHLLRETIGVDADECEDVFASPPRP